MAMAAPLIAEGAVLSAPLVAEGAVLAGGAVAAEAGALGGLVSAEGAAATGGALAGATAGYKVLKKVAKEGKEVKKIAESVYGLGKSGAHLGGKMVNHSFGHKKKHENKLDGEDNSLQLHHMYNPHV